MTANAVVNTHTYTAINFQKYNIAYSEENKNDGNTTPQTSVNITWLTGYQSIRLTSATSAVVPPQRNCRSCSFMLCICFIALLHFAAFTHTDKLSSLQDLHPRLSRSSSTVSLVYGPCVHIITQMEWILYCLVVCLWQQTLTVQDICANLLVFVCPMQCRALDRIQNYFSVRPSVRCPSRRQLRSTLWAHFWTDLHQIWNTASPYHPKENILWAVPEMGVARVTW